MERLKLTKTLPASLIFLGKLAAIPMTSDAKRLGLTGKNMNGRLLTSKSAPPIATRKPLNSNGLIWLPRFLLLGGVIGSASALGLTVDSEDTAKLVDKGALIFNKETFNGNGRTCGTCHIDSKHYNISPKDIKEIKNPKLRELIFLTHTVPGFENEKLVRDRALFNIGPDIGAGNNPKGPFRTTMTTGGMELTDTDSRSSPDRRAITLGWAADGSPLDNDPKNPFTGSCGPADGTIEAFAIGAVAQHATKTLARIAGVDFRCPTGDELTAMGAFQRWLGRQFELDIATITFSDARANAGRELFLNSKFGCDACHNNAGANAAFSPGNNANFETNVDFFGKNPVLGVTIPKDEGDLLGEEEVPPDSPCHSTDPDTCVEGVGFNSQSLVEAARKNQFNHNGSVIGSIEDAAKFYFTDTFNNSPAGHGKACAVAGDRLGVPSAPIGVGGASGDNTTCVNPTSPPPRVPVPLIPADYITLADIQSEFGRDAFNKLGFFLKSLSAVYSLNDCRRLVDETILRIDNGLPTNLPVKHCKFNLDDVASVLKSTRAGPLSRAYSNVVIASSDLKVQLALAAKNHDTSKLKVIKDKLNNLRKKIATTTPAELP
jgi:hypothetical protein